jgi:hypothetical protein
LEPGFQRGREDKARIHAVTPFFGFALASVKKAPMPTSAKKTRIDEPHKKIESTFLKEKTCSSKLK